MLPNKNDDALNFVDEQNMISLVKLMKTSAAKRKKMENSLPMEFSALVALVLGILHMDLS